MPAPIPRQYTRSDAVIMARELALKHVRPDVDAGLSEGYIQSTHHGSGRGWKFVENNGDDGFGPYDVQIGGGYDQGPDGRFRKTAPTTKVLVREVCGITVDMLFSLHELYLECQTGQLALL